MTRTHRLVNIVGIVGPLVGTVVAIVLLWHRFVGWSDLGIAAGLYLLTGMGITVGMHRHLAHRAFKTHRWVRALLAVLGSMAVEGPVISWVSNHRKHHAHADQPGDPHSPHVHSRGDLHAGWAGLVHAHVGWIVSEPTADADRYAPDLRDDRAIRRINRLFPLWALLTLALPAALGWALTGTLEGALTAFLWGGLVRIFLLHHVTFAINSLCHWLGTRRFQTRDHSRNLAWLAPISFGEAWHHNHHAFPTSAFHGLRRWELDPGRGTIRLLERLGLAWDVVRITPERQQAKLAGSSAR